jgi:hypothetical protein
MGVIKVEEIERLVEALKSVNEALENAFYHLCLADDQLKRGDWERALANLGLVDIWIEQAGKRLKLACGGYEG